MEPIPHIDVAEEARIEALLAAPGNHSWPAIDSESMDGWVPDLGLTGYANYSIYRPPAVAAAGVTTTVRHRFRVPPRNPKLPGPYYLAALIYDKAGEEFPLELSLGSEEVGRIEPRRHDNRRHLIVIDRPILFDDRVKWVEFTSDGRGECRIERFVLLAQAPEPSSFAPAIERLHVEVDASGDAAAATVHCLTFPPSTVTASVRDQAGATVAESAPDGPSTLHAVALAGLPLDRTWAVRLTATEQDGDTTESVCEFSTSRPKARSASAETTVEAEVELCAAGAAASLAGLPLTFGVPVRRGALFSGARRPARVGRRRSGHVGRPDSRPQPLARRFRPLGTGRHHRASPAPARRPRGLPRSAQRRGRIASGRSAQRRRTRRRRRRGRGPGHQGFRATARGGLDPRRTAGWTTHGSPGGP